MFDVNRVVACPAAVEFTGRAQDETPVLDAEGRVQAPESLHRCLLLRRRLQHAFDKGREASQTSLYALCRLRGRADLAPRSQSVGVYTVSADINTNEELIFPFCMIKYTVCT